MSLPEGFTLRRATTADLDTLVDHRRAMFEDMGYTDHAAMSSMSGKNSKRTVAFQGLV